MLILAELGSICDRESACIVNQDSGLTLAHTIAHEMGHTLNLLHTEDYGRPTECEEPAGHFVMASTLIANIRV